MKRLFFILSAVCICMITYAQRVKVESFDKNTWRWLEGTDKYQSVAIEDGFLTISSIKPYKKANPYQNSAKTYAKLPFRPNDNFKITINYYVPLFQSDWLTLFFNTDKQCLQDDEGLGQFGTYTLFIGGQDWGLNLGDYGGFHGKLPGKYKQKKNVPMQIVMEKKQKNLMVEINNIEIFNGECKISSPCIGFMVPLFAGKKPASIKIDEITIEQAEEED